MPLTRYQVGKGGEASYEILRSRTCEIGVYAFGEKVMWRVADTKAQGKSVLRWFHGVWVGVHTHPRGLRVGQER